MLRNYTHDLHIMASLEKDQEWEKLECWMGIVWIVWPPQDGKTTEEYNREVEAVMLSLFYRRPSATQKLEQWMARGIKWHTHIPESFRQICRQAHSRAAQQGGS